MTALIERDVAVLICSRGREDLLGRLLEDLGGGFLPALAAGGIGAAVVVYAQGYGPEALERLARRFGPGAGENLILVPAGRPHARIGDVVRTAAEGLHARLRYRLAMLMDDDSTYEARPATDANLRRAAQTFLERGHRAYSIKLGPEETLRIGPFVDPDGPIMPFKEKMMWVSRPVLDAVLAQPRFAELSIGEDAVVAALAWLAEPRACLAVHGIGGFLHLGFEAPADAAGGELPGGYGELMGYAGPSADTPHGKYDAALRHGVTPHHVMPDVFVGEDHPHYIYNGIRPEVLDRLRARGLLG